MKKVWARNSKQSRDISKLYLEFDGDDGLFAVTGTNLEWDIARSSIREPGNSTTHRGKNLQQPSQVENKVLNNSRVSYKYFRT
jgi:hypothetical protein